MSESTWILSDLDMEGQEAVREYMEITERMKLMEKRKRQLKDTLLSHLQDVPNNEVLLPDGDRLAMIERKGSINWKKVEMVQTAREIAMAEARETGVPLPRNRGSVYVTIKRAEE